MLIVERVRSVKIFVSKPLVINDNERKYIIDLKK
jgi:hypothetical protein